MRNLVEGETKPVDMTCYDGDGPSRTVTDLTGLTVALQLRDRTGALVATAGEVTVLSAVDGTVRYSPAATDLKAANGPYAARVKVTDGNGDDAYYPNGAADVWMVRQ